MMNRTVFLVALGLCLPATSAHAYSPPVDTAGPLTVRIEGPEVVTKVDTPLPVRVLLENKGGTPLSGTLRLGLVDRWKAKPAEPVRFSVPAGGKTVYKFQVTAGKGTYSDVHYPIHAFARFKLDGREQTAHPILILQTKFPRPPKVMVPVEWKPVKVPEAGQLALWRVPVKRVVIQVFGEKPLVMPVGWQGSEKRTAGSFHIGRHAPDGQGREAIGMHPPWLDSHVGTMLVEFPLVLPKTGPIKLSFAGAVRPEGQGDGVTFRVRAVPLEAPAGQFGEVLFERHSAAKTWQEAEVDLSKLAGQSIRLQLESHPGPKNNTNWDQSYWAEPVLSAGTPPQPIPFPPKDNAGSQVLGTLKRGSTQYEVRVWPGRRGLLDSVIGFTSGDRRLFFRGFSVRVSGDQLEDVRSPTLLVEAKQEPIENGYQVRHGFKQFEGDSFDLVGRLYVERETLKASFRLENTPQPRPWQVVYLEDVAAGPWSQTARRVYAGHGNVICKPGPFRLGYDGHRLATSFVGFDFSGGLSLVQAVDVPPSHLEVQPADRHYSLHAPHASTSTFIPAENVWDAAKVYHDTNGLKAAGGVRKAAGRFVFDLWGGRYGESAEALRRAFRYGLTDSMVLWHNWQRWGYDYRLPDIYPPNPKLGTLEEMQELARVCKVSGVPFGPHDNYIDFYPDADGFSYEKNIAFNHSGSPVKAWINEGRDARSYRYRADRVAPLLERNLKQLREHLAPTAYFIDVWSSIGCYDYWTADGKFFDRVFTRTTWGELFAWIRELLGNDAPQISESGHDQLIGWLDGATTNHLRVGKPIPGNRLSWCVWNIRCADAERIPWFDTAHHDRFILHGAGYSGRYQAGLDARLHGVYSDDYIATEVLTGHPAMVPEPFGHNVVRKYWLLGELMRALAMRRIEGVEFVGHDIHRQHVRWDGGGQVWVNRGESDWTVDGVVLPEFGFLARVPTDKGPVEASITRRDGVIVETARSAGHFYVNGRRVVATRLPIRLAVKELKYLGGRKFELALVWQADEPIPAGWSPFLHFCDAADEIVFQPGHHPGTFESEQKGEVVTKAWSTVPSDATPGDTFELRAGIYNRKTGQRLALCGPDDGGRRIRLGTIRLEGEGKRLGGIAWTPHKPKPDPLLARQNPDSKPIDFGPVTTAGGCRLSLDGRALLVTPLPTSRGPEFTVRLRPAALGWKLPEPKFAEALDLQGKVLGRQPVDRQDDSVVVVCRPGVFAYRLTPE